MSITASRDTADDLDKGSAPASHTASEDNIVRDEAAILRGTPTDVEKGSEAPVAGGPPVGKPTMPTFPEGGLMGWMCVAGSWLVLFCTFGMANTFGVFQSYYQFTGYPQDSSSTISWIGSIQLFLQFFLGAVAGPLYDRGYFRPLVYTGSVIYIVCFFMVSLCHSLWQVMLAQGVGCGIGIGILFLPSISVVSQYFFKRRAAAIGIVVTGSSIGGICLPIMLNNLINSHGFERAVQYTGYVILGALVLACMLMQPRVGAVKAQAKKPTPKELFESKPYAFAVVGLFLVAWGLFFPIFYLQVFAEEHGIDTNLVFYTLAILNAASIFGRISPNFLADYFGSLNLLTIMCYGAGFLCFSVLGAGSFGGLIVVAIIFGFFSGAYVSLMTPAIITLSKGPHEIGIRLGTGFLITSFAALTGTPITGALLDKYGFVAPVVWSGVTVLAGAMCFTVATLLQRRVKGNWKV